MKISKLIAVLAVLLSLTSVSAEESDPFLWLEDIEGDKALAWVEEQNQKSLAALEQLPQFQAMYEKNLGVYNSKERIPYPKIRGGYLYNFWRDGNNERGLWRRTTFEQYASENPQWEILLDLDKLAQEEDENWIWKGSDCLRPDYQRCLLFLSRGGADATVTREFDIPGKTFVEDGFNLPEAKAGVSFIDRNTVFVSTDFGEGSMTESGYPRIVKLWKRGSPLGEATVVYEGLTQDVGVQALVVNTPEKDYSLVVRADTFFTSEVFAYRGGTLQKLDIPPDADIEAIFKNQLLISLKTDWERDGTNWKQGSLVSIDVDELLQGEGRVIQVVEPDARSALSGVDRTRDLLLVNSMIDVRSKLEAYNLVDGKWQKRSIDRHHQHQRRQQLFLFQLPGLSHADYPLPG
jgi:prolyl oligopeptidase